MIYNLFILLNFIFFYKSSLQTLIYSSIAIFQRNDKYLQNPSLIFNKFRVISSNSVYVCFYISRARGLILFQPGSIRQFNRFWNTWNIYIHLSWMNFVECKVLLAWRHKDVITGNIPRRSVLFAILENDIFLHIL